MRKANERPTDSGIYARVREVQMSEADRQYAIRALRQAEELGDALLWIKEKFADIGNLFLKPGLKH